MTIVPLKAFHHPSRYRALRFLLLISLLVGLSPSSPRARAGGDSMVYVDSYLWSAPNAIQLRDTIAYVVFAHGLATYNLASADNPIEVSRLSFEEQAGGGVLSAGLLFVPYVASNGSEGGIYIVDVSDPTQPHVTSLITL